MFLCINNGWATNCNFAQKQRIMTNFHANFRAISSSWTTSHARQSHCLVDFSFSPAKTYYCYNTFITRAAFFVWCDKMIHLYVCVVVFFGIASLFSLIYWHSNGILKKTKGKKSAAQIEARVSVRVHVIWFFFSLLSRLVSYTPSAAAAITVLFEHLWYSICVYQSQLNWFDYSNRTALWWYFGVS